MLVARVQPERAPRVGPGRLSALRPGLAGPAVRRLEPDLDVRRARLVLVGASAPTFLAARAGHAVERPPARSGVARPSAAPRPPAGPPASAVPPGRPARPGDGSRRR